MGSSRKNKDDFGDNHKCWEDLPSDILRSICCKLLNNEFESDTLELRKLCSVCTSWRSSILPLRSRKCVRFPLKLPPPLPSMCPSSSTADHNITATLSQSHIFLFTPPSGDLISNNNGWIVKVGVRSEWNGVRSDWNSWCLENPFGVSRASFNVEGSVNILVNPVKQITRSYLLQYVTYGGEPRFAKVVIILNEGFDDFSALALFEGGKLGLWRSGEGRSSWNNFEGDQNASFSDIIAFKGKYYATTMEAKLMMIDPVTYEVNSVITDKLASEGLVPEFSRLVESNGHLYLVQKGISRLAQGDRLADAVRLDQVCTSVPPLARGDRLADARRLFEARMRVPPLGRGDRLADASRLFEARPREPSLAQHGHTLTARVSMLESNIGMNCNQICSWKFVDNLEDRVFFSSKYVSFSLTAKDLGWFEGNCVLFPMNFKELSTVRFSSEVEKAIVRDQQHFANCLSVFTLEDLTMSFGSNLAGQFTNIFWPPPEWLLQVC